MFFLKKRVRNLNPYLVLRDLMMSVLFLSSISLCSCRERVNLDKNPSGVRIVKSEIKTNNLPKIKNLHSVDLHFKNPMSTDTLKNVMKYSVKDEKGVEQAVMVVVNGSQKSNDVKLFCKRLISSKKYFVTIEGEDITYSFSFDA